MQSAQRNTADEDAECMARIARHDRQALGELVARHQERIRAQAYRMCGRWETADDIVQETFLRAYRAAGTYRPVAAVTTWLHRIAVNLCLDHARRPRLAPLDEDLAGLVTEGSDETLLQEERVAAVRRAIAELPERQRMALTLHRFSQMSVAEIAQNTGWTPSAVESLLSRAYDHLRQKLASWR